MLSGARGGNRVVMDADADADAYADADADADAGADAGAGAGADDNARRTQHDMGWVWVRTGSVRGLLGMVSDCTHSRGRAAFGAFL